MGLYVVLVMNQASGLVDHLADDTVHWEREDADQSADYHREETAKVGRGERYVVAELEYDMDELR